MVTCVVCAFVLSGCETSSTDTGDVTPATSSTVTVVPTSIELSTATITSTKFTARGGDSNYTWSISDTNLGTLYTSTGATAIYQNTTNAGANVLLVTDTTSNSASATIE